MGWSRQRNRWPVQSPDQYESYALLGRPVVGRVKQRGLRICGIETETVPERLKDLHYFFKCRPQPGVRVYLVGFHLGTLVERNVSLSGPEKARDLLKHEILRAYLFYNPDELMNCVSPVVAEPVSRSSGSEWLAWRCASHHGYLTDFEVS